jgi:hypothetical protein
MGTPTPDRRYGNVAFPTSIPLASTGTNRGEVNWGSVFLQLEETFPMRAVLVGAALVAFAVTPSLADYYIIQDATTKRCRIVEEGPAPGIGVVIGGVGFGVRTEAESRMRTVEECRESGTTGGGVTIEERQRVPAERVR